MAAVSDDPAQTSKPAVPTPAAPSPQMFARPAAAATDSHATDSHVTACDGTAQHADREATTAGAASRFASTGDPQVDRALAQLPDPDEHRRPPDSARVSGHREDAVGSDETHESSDCDSRHEPGRAENDGNNDTATGTHLPDPGLLDAHLADVTSVHRLLQQRLSDLSG